MADIFKLPASSYEELVKLIQAYASEKEGVLLSLDDISHSTGIDRTRVSANNGFFVQIGLITEGVKKTSTENGRSLGRAYASRIDYEINRIWREVITENDFLNRMVSAVRIRNGMDRANFLSHIIYSSGQKESKQSRTGAGAIIEIFKIAEILSETDGKLTVNELPLEQPTSPVVMLQPQEASPVVDSPHSCNAYAITSQAGVVININITCTPNDIGDLGEKLKNLLQQISE